MVLLLGPPAQKQSLTIIKRPPLLKSHFVSLELISFSKTHSDNNQATTNDFQATRMGSIVPASVKSNALEEKGGGNKCRSGFTFLTSCPLALGDHQVLKG